MARRCLPEIDATACSRSDRAPLPPMRITANNIHTWLLIGTSSTPPQTFNTRSRFNRVRNPSRRPPRVASLKQMRRRLVMPVSRYRGQPSRRRHGCATAACLGRDASWSRNCANALRTRAGATAANVAARTRHDGERSVAQRPKQEWGVAQRPKQAPSRRGGYERREGRPSGREVRTGSKGKR